MSLRKISKIYFLGALAIGIAAIATLAPAHAQINRTGRFDPLETYARTWVATKPGESTPFLVLKFTERNGKLTATMSHFKIGVIGHGTIVGEPIAAADSTVSDLTVGEGGVAFTWNADPPLHGGRVEFVGQGTRAARLMIPVTIEESTEILAASRGADGLNPVISMHRPEEAGSGNQPEDLQPKWKIAEAVRLINEAEVRYRFARRSYADYATLLRSGELRQAARTGFTLVPVDLRSATNPLPGSSIRLLVSPDHRSYQLSIEEKTSAKCAIGLFSDETGIAFEGQTAECAAGTRTE
jgi:hypothetical protein